MPSITALGGGLDASACNITMSPAVCLLHGVVLYAFWATTVVVPSRLGLTWIAAVHVQQVRGVRQDQSTILLSARPSGSAGSPSSSLSSHAAQRASHGQQQGRRVLGQARSVAAGAAAAAGSGDGAHWEPSSSEAWPGGMSLARAQVSSPPDVAHAVRIIALKFSRWLLLP